MTDTPVPRCRVCGGTDRPLLICVEVGGRHRQSYLHPVSMYQGGCWLRGLQSRDIERIEMLPPEPPTDGEP